MKKRWLCMVLSLGMMMGVLSGCGATEKGTAPDESTQPAVEESAETDLREELKEELREELKEELKQELAEASVDEPVNTEPAEEDAIEEAEPEQESEGDAGFQANLAEFLASAEGIGLSWEDHGKWKASYYADDINQDGFPEIFQYLYHDETADRREFRFFFYFMNHHWDDEKHREVYYADRSSDIESGTWGVHDTSMSTGKTGVDISYTVNCEDILAVTDVCVGSASGAVENKIQKTRIVFRDGEALPDGYGTFTHTQDGAIDKTTYLTFEANMQYWEDEDHFNAVDSDFTSEVTIHFGEDELWSTMQDALEHLGEMP